MACCGSRSRGPLILSRRWQRGKQLAAVDPDVVYADFETLRMKWGISMIESTGLPCTAPPDQWSGLESGGVDCTATAAARAALASLILLMRPTRLRTPIQLSKSSQCWSERRLRRRIGVAEAPDAAYRLIAAAMDASRGEALQRKTSRDRGNVPFPREALSRSSGIRSSAGGRKRFTGPRRGVAVVPAYSRLLRLASRS